MKIEQYSDLYNQSAAKYGLDPALLMAQGEYESSGDPNAIGQPTKYGRAKGLAQFIPATAKSLGVTDPTDPAQAIDGQARLMAENLKRYKDPEKALMAYHGGTDESKWGDKTRAYPREVYKRYKGEMKMASTAPEMDEDEAIIQSVRDELAAKKKAESPDYLDPNDDDAIFAAARADIAAQKRAQPVEVGPKWLQNVGEVGGSVAESLGNAAYKGTQALGENMTPLKMAAIVPSMAVAPAMSTLAGAASGVPYLGTALQYAAGIAPEGAGLASQLGHSVVSGAVQGGITNKLMGGSALEGAETGAILNPSIMLAGKAVAPLYNKITGAGKQITPEVAQLARKASNEYGIDIPGGLLSDDPVINRSYSLLSRFGMTPTDNNEDNLIRAASKTFGENTPKLTRSAMDTAETNIGNMFDDVWNKTPGLKLDKPGSRVLDTLADIDDEANVLMPNDNRISKQIKNIIDIAANNNGEIPSSVAKNLVSTKSTLHKLTRVDDRNVADAAYDIKNALYEALGENAPPEVLDKYNTAKAFYKNYKTIESAKPNPVTGEINPTAIANAVNKTAKRFGRNGLQQLQDLGDIGQQFKLTPSSGTAENYLLAKIASLTGNALAGGAGYALGGAPGIVAGYAAGKGAGNYLAGEGYRNRLIDSALGGKSMLDLLTYNPGVSNAVIAGKQMLTPPTK